MSAKAAIPKKRPRLFINNPEEEYFYAYLLNAKTKERRKYFKIAVKNAVKEGIKLDEVTFDTPDKWYQWAIDAFE